jgi:hypothetical protein
MASPVGNALGVAVAPLLVTRHTHESGGGGDDDKDNCPRVQGMTAFMILQLALAGLSTLWAWWALRDRPPTPPSHAAAQERALEEAARQQEQRQQRRRQRASWRQAVEAGWAPVKACWHSGRDFRVLLWCFGLGCVGLCRMGLLVG